MLLAPGASVGLGVVGARGRAWRLRCRCASARVTLAVRVSVRRPTAGPLHPGCRLPSPSTSASLSPPTSPASA
eukprot:1191247-Alexandrium_andersonii.AAC.1